MDFGTHKWPIFPYFKLFKINLTYFTEFSRPVRKPPLWILRTANFHRDGNIWRHRWSFLEQFKHPYQYFSKTFHPMELGQSLRSSPGGSTVLHLRFADDVLYQRLSTTRKRSDHKSGPALLWRQRIQRGSGSLVSNSRANRKILIPRPTWKPQNFNPTNFRLHLLRPLLFNVWFERFTGNFHPNSASGRRLGSTDLHVPIGRFSNGYFFESRWDIFAIL